MSADLQAVANQLTDLCKQGKFREALDALYDENIHCSEPAEFPGMPRVTEGLAAAQAGDDWWMENHEIHSFEVKGPFLHLSDRFAVTMNLDVTAKGGPKAGERMQMEEICLYTVANGKITKAEFFYDLPPGSCE